MKIIITQPNNSPLNVLRRLGYSFQRKEEGTGEMSFVRRVGMADYPRFHIYSKVTPRGTVEVNLHIDQKKASYEGSTAHSGEYEVGDNEWIAREAEVIKREFEN